MKKKYYLGMPAYFVYGILGVCIVGIIIGSFYDFQVSQALDNRTDIGTFFAHYSSYLAYCLYPAAGVCLFKGVRKKGKEWELLAWVLLIGSYLITIYYSNNYYGKYLIKDLGYVPGESSPARYLLTILVWALAYSWVPVLCWFVIDDSHPDLLIVIGSVILIAGILGDYVNIFLKNFAARPRYRYALEQDNPMTLYRPWWDFSPLTNETDEFESWPSGHMTKASILFALPMFADVVKVKHKWIRPFLMAVSCILVALVGYNRIHMAAHYLSDVCFGVLFTFGVFLLVYWAINRGHDFFEKEREIPQKNS